MTPPVRKAAVAGSWYPGTAGELAAEIGRYLDGVPAPSVSGRLVALVSPHAGLRYSGPVAAFGYALLRGRAGLTAVLVGPAHHARFDGCAVYARGAFDTPLGPAPIEEDLAAAMIAEHPLILDRPEPHADEHSIEMQLPFLKHLVDDVRIVPVLMGSQSREEVEALAGVLARTVAARGDVVLIASSDLSHYHPAAEAHRLDALVVGDVEQFDADGLLTRLERSPGHACGGGPMVAVMKAARALGADRAQVLRYADSGDAGERDKRRVVGYVSAVLAAS